MMTRHLPSLVLLQLAAVLAAQPPIAPTQSAPQTLAEAWRAALAQGKQQKAPILAFVLPPADAPADADRAKALRELEQKNGMLFGKRGEDHPIPSARQLLLRQVQWLRSAGARAAVRAPAAAPSVVQTLLAMTITVFATPEACGAKAGETIVLLDARGQRIAGLHVDAGDREAFARELGKLLLADEALAARQATVPPALAADLRQRRSLAAATGPGPSPEVAAANARELQQIDERLQANLAGVAPLFVGGTAEQREFATESSFESLRPPLGCTAEILAGDPCPACGMGFVPPELNTVLKLLGP